MQNAKLSFRKEERLKSKKKITELFEQGKIIHSHPFKVLYSFSGNDDIIPAQIAISVSKKNFKRAVDRNRIKRKVRESYRLNKNQLYSYLIKNNQKLFLFVIYTATQDYDFIKINDQMQSLIIKLIDNLPVN